MSSLQAGISHHEKIAPLATKQFAFILWLFISMFTGHNPLLAVLLAVVATTVEVIFGIFGIPFLLGFFSIITVDGRFLAGCDPRSVDGAPIDGAGKMCSAFLALLFATAVAVGVQQAGVGTWVFGTWVFICLMWVIALPYYARRPYLLLLSATTIVAVIVDFDGIASLAWGDEAIWLGMQWAQRSSSLA